jgi:glycosyltransferase involved in cell wall biosynthesis
MSRRLVFISNLFPDHAQPYFGLDNATVLHALVRDYGWDVRVLCPRPTLAPKDYLHDGPHCEPRAGDEIFQPRYVAVPYAPKIGGLANRALMRSALRGPLRALRKTFAFDVVLASWLFPDACAAAELAQRKGVPSVLITQGSDTHQYLAMPLRRRQILRAIEQCHSVIARSGDLGKRLASAGADAAKLHTVYNGVDTAVFQPRDRSQARAELGLDPSANVFLFVGNFLAVKNPALLVRAFASYREASGDHTSVLLMAGKGPMQPEISALADSLGLGTSVRQTGPMNSTQIAQLMAAADALCLSSVNEGLPNVILEAMACGLPVLSTNVGGIAEVLDESRGVLVPEGELAPYAVAMPRVLQLRSHRDTIADYGSRFTWPRAAGEYDALLARAAGI